MTKVLQSGWMLAVAGGISYLLTTAMLWHAPLKPNAPAAPVAATPPASTLPLGFFNPEVDALIRELKAEKDDLKAQRSRLEDWAARLQAERAEINSVTQVVQQMQAELDRTVVRVREEEKANLKRLAKIYAGMSPEGAVKIIAEMEDDQILKLLTSMKEAETAPILEQLGKEPAQAKRVARLTERLRLVVESGSQRPNTPNAPKL